MRELILYLANRGDADPSLGRTKLNKLLFYCDFTAYLELGSPMTGFPYRKLPYGPVPDKELLEQEMIEAGELSHEMLPVHNFTRDRPVAMRQANMESFSQEELDIIETVYGLYEHSTGDWISRHSHSFVGWRIATVGEHIPYSMILIGDRALSQAEIDYGLRLAKELPDRSSD